MAATIIDYISLGIYFKPTSNPAIAQNIAMDSVSLGVYFKPTSNATLRHDMIMDSISLGVEAAAEIIPNATVERQKRYDFKL